MNTNNTTSRFARYFALPNIVATPNVKAHPAPNAMPGGRWHHGIQHLGDLQPSYIR